MRYLGGKERIAQRLADFINPLIMTHYVEPFVGGASVISRIKAPRRLGADANEALITMWQALCSGWEPPETLSEPEFKALKTCRDMSNPLTAFAGFGCSFAGDWFHGFAKDSKGTNYAARTAASLKRKALGLRDVSWVFSDYRDLFYPANSVIYCDPPYANSVGYGAVGPFDSDAFWSFCSNKEKQGHTVLVSEYSAPAGFTCVFEIPKRLAVRLSDGSQPMRLEKLFAPSRTAKSLKPTSTAEIAA